MTRDRMKMLMLTMPFMVRDLIAPEVCIYLTVDGIYCVVLSIYMYMSGFAH